MNILNTTSSSYFFSRTLNLIFSVRFNTKKPIDFIVWDIGLKKIERFFLRCFKVKVIKVPSFCEFWRDCYTWKTYIYQESKERYFLHLDAGNTVLCDIDIIFEMIKKNGYFFVDQGQSLLQIAPAEYFSYFKIDDSQDYTVIAAGNIGFDRNIEDLSEAVKMSYESALKGMCLGYSYAERNRAATSEFIVRDCEVFRHDQTVLNCCVRSKIKDFDVLPYSIYSAVKRKNDVKIFNQRKLSYEFLLRKINFTSILAYLYCLINDSFFYVKIKCEKIVKKIKY